MKKFLYVLLMTLVFMFSFSLVSFADTSSTAIEVEEDEYEGEGEMDPDEPVLYEFEEETKISGEGKKIFVRFAEEGSQIIPTHFEVDYVKAVEMYAYEFEDRYTFTIVLHGNDGAYWPELIVEKKDLKINMTTFAPKVWKSLIKKMNSVTIDVNKFSYPGNVVTKELFERFECFWGKNGVVLERCEFF